MHKTKHTITNDQPRHITPPNKRIQACVAVPGSKSYTLRALFLAALTPGPITIHRPLASQDTDAAITCLTKLGIKITQKKDYIIVKNDISVIKDRAYLLDVDLSGVTLRFLIALSCVIPGVQTIHGKSSLNNRPVAPLVDTLRQLGADIDYLEKDGHPPIRVNSSKITGTAATIDGSMSSQYISAVLMIAPLMPSGLELCVDGVLASAPYVDMTIDTLGEFGIVVQNNKHKVLRTTADQHYHAADYTVEGDVSSASYFFAIAALTKSNITVTNINPDSQQADMKILPILELMGCHVAKHTDSISVIGNSIKPLTIDMELCPDQVMTIAVIAAFARGTTTISGVRTLRVKETERVIAIENELAKMGIRTSSTEDVLTIYGGKPKSATIDTYGDHRIAMSFAMAGMVLDGMVINHPGVVNKTFPTFWNELSKLESGQTTTKSRIRRRLTLLKEGVFNGR